MNNIKLKSIIKCHCCTVCWTICWWNPKPPQSISLCPSIKTLFCKFKTSHRNSWRAFPNCIHKHAGKQYICNYIINCIFFCLFWDKKGPCEQWLCVHVHMYIMPIVAWPLLQVIPINKMYILTHGHDFKRSADFAYVVHQMCLLNAWLPSENIIASSQEDVLLVIVF